MTFSLNLFFLSFSHLVNTPNVCKLEPQSGSCYGLNERYYFNGETGSCEIFNYGGCQGNGNNFMTIEDCQSMCSPMKRSIREVSETPQPSPTNETIEQQPQQQSPNETITSPPAEPIVTTSKPNNPETEAPTPPKTREEVCFQPFAEGNCKENLIRYYYDPESNKCKKFIFKGCFQYDNNFEKLEDCESLCVVPTPSPQPPPPTR